MSLKWVLIFEEEETSSFFFFECTFYGIGVIARIDEIVIGWSFVFRVHEMYMNKEDIKKDYQDRCHSYIV